MFVVVADSGLEYRPHLQLIHSTKLENIALTTINYNEYFCYGSALETLVATHMCDDASYWLIG